MPLKPWYNVAVPREDLREGRPLDTAEFAVHLDQVRDGRAPSVYQNPRQFFERTYLTQSLTGLAAESVRRLSGIQTETSAVFNFVTQFGGGKTHALTLLYHLARHGDTAMQWPGVRAILDKAGVSTIPQAAAAVFAGIEFDSMRGRGGDDGTPLRKTPWGEIAFQLGGAEGFAVVAEHDQQLTAPAGDVIRQMLPHDRPCLILMDELINYVSRNRANGLSAQLYNFLHTLSETVRGLPNAVLAVSIPKSQMEMSTEDEDDYHRLEKLLDRVGKAVMLSAESETSEIIRRRLFEWDLQAVGQGGQVALSREARQTCNEYANWVQEHRQVLPSWFPVDTAREAFATTYPFHPVVLSVFERKWQALPRFQRTRGILRLLALWVSRAYQDGFKGAHRDPLIDLGSAPLDDPSFRAAVFEQLGENRLEAAVTTDISGRKEAHAIRLDSDAAADIKKARLHRKVATTIFFESNGGQAQGYTTEPEIRLAVAAPGLEIVNIETVLEALVPPSGACYYLDTARRRYWFSVRPNLTKLLADRKASVQPQDIQELVDKEIQKVFTAGTGIERKYFPEKSSQIPDQAALTLIVSDPARAPDDPATLAWIEQMTRESGGAGRTHKSALIWALADGAGALQEEARKLLAWQAIQEEREDLRLDEGQQGQLANNLSKAAESLREAVWRSYKYIALLDKHNNLRIVDLGLVHSNTAKSPVHLILNRLRIDGDIEESISPNFLVRNWSPAFTEWSTRAVRDAFFASPLFPRLMHGDAIKDTIAKGVANGFLAYVGKAADGSYEPFWYQQPLSANEVEISHDMFIITRDAAEAYLDRLPKLTTLVLHPSEGTLKPGASLHFTVQGKDQHGQDIDIGPVTWHAQGGTISQDGRFQAGHEQGTSVVTASNGGLSGTATITITKAVRDSSEHYGPEPTTKPETPTAEPGTPTSTNGVAAESAAPAHTLAWSGDVSWQKWQNFYMKVVSRFANKPGQAVTLTVKLEVNQEAGLSQQQIDEVRLALRELGLADEVTIS